MRDRIHSGNASTQTHSHTFTPMANLDFPVPPTLHVFGLREETRADQKPVKTESVSLPTVPLVCPYPLMYFTSGGASLYSA